MPTLLSQPARVTAAGNKPKLIDEYIGRLNSKNEAVSIAHKGEWVRYSTPDPEGAEYIAVCLPAFSMETVHRDTP